MLPKVRKQRPKSDPLPFRPAPPRPVISHETEPNDAPDSFLSAS
jgi:hypothetical protein